MNNVARALTLLAALVLLILPMAPAQAPPLPARTWVSGTGDDNNPCSRGLPCKTFSRALFLAAPGGEINCLDPGDFGPVSITKSISIVCDEEVGHIIAANASVEGITVNVGAGDDVTLRGLDLDGLGTGSIGIAFIGGGSLHVQEVVIRNFAATGLLFRPTKGTAKLHVSDETLISNCGGTDPGEAGIAVEPFGGDAVVTINGVQMRGNSNGILVAPINSIANLHVRDTVAASSNNHGMLVTTGGPHAGATIDRSNFLFNGGDGLKVDGAGAIAIIGSSTISGNLNLGVEATGGGTLLSWENNQIAGNVSDGTPIPAFAGPGGPLQ